MTGLDPLKPILTALVLPPVPWLLLVLLGGALLRARARFGALLLGLGAALIWLSACTGTGRWLQASVLQVPPPLSPQAVAALAALDARRSDTAIVVLGGGRELRAPETGAPDLKTPSLQRLRHGIRLARETGLPLAFVGGVGWGAQVQRGASEAEIARRIAKRDFGHPITWLETASRDTRQNAAFGVPLLHSAGIRHIVLVTHATHMPRAQREFEHSAAGQLRVTPAATGYYEDGGGVMAWLPSAAGFEQVRGVLREQLALAVVALRPN